MESILKAVLQGEMHTANYPLLIEHILREAKLYRELVCRLEEGKGLDFQSMAQTEQFWNQNMMEHALFIRGLLDPCEEDLVKTADGFAGEYRRLLEQLQGGGDFYDDYTTTYSSGIRPGNLCMTMCALNLCCGTPCGWHFFCC